MDLTVIDGEPLPFAFDNRVFAKYPNDIPDYFKQTFPDEYFWERTMTYEDGGTCIATNDIT